LKGIFEHSEVPFVPTALSITIHAHAHLLVILDAQVAKLPTCVCVDCSFMGRTLTDSDFGGGKFLCKFGALLIDYTMSISEDESSYRERGSLKSHYIAQLHIYLIVIHGVLR